MSKTKHDTCIGSLEVSGAGSGSGWVVAIIEILKPAQKILLFLVSLTDRSTMEPKTYARIEAWWGMRSLLRFKRKYQW